MARSDLGTVKGIAEALGVPVSTLAKAAEKGELTE